MKRGRTNSINIYNSPHKRQRTFIKSETAIPVRIMARSRRSYRRRRPYKRRFARFRKFRRTRRIKRMPLASQATRKVIKLRYVDDITIDAGIGALGTYVFRANSIYDPNYTGVGHQPRGRDEWALFYNKYVVLGSKITVKFQTTDSAASAPCKVGIAVKDVATVLSNATAYAENMHSRWSFIGTRDSGKPMTTITHKVNPRKFLNKKTFDDPNLEGGLGTSASNPTEEIFYHLFVQNEAQAVDLGTIFCSVMIEYLVALREPISLGAS